MFRQKITAVCDGCGETVTGASIEEVLKKMEDWYCSKNPSARSVVYCPRCFSGIRQYLDYETQGSSGEKFIKAVRVLFDKIAGISVEWERVEEEISELLGSGHRREKEPMSPPIRPGGPDIDGSETK